MDVQLIDSDQHQCARHREADANALYQHQVEASGHLCGLVSAADLAMPSAVENLSFGAVILAQRRQLVRTFVREMRSMRNAAEMRATYTGDVGAAAPRITSQLQIRARG